MRISDWSSDVCSSDLLPDALAPRMLRKPLRPAPEWRPPRRQHHGLPARDRPPRRSQIRHQDPPRHSVDRQVMDRKPQPPGDRKSVVSGKRVSVRVELGGRRSIKKKTEYTKE